MTEATCPRDCLELANAMADAVRAIVRPYFRRRLAVDAKADSSPVTIADREAETAMREMIGAAFPEHGIRGEEFGVHRPEAEWVWVLDPIDGTKSFISGSLAFGTQIALLHRGVPVLGIIDQPITCERWLGQAGAATVLNGQPVRTSDTRGIEQAIVYTSALEQFDADRHRRFAALASKARFTRMSHDGYAAGLLALGGVDLLLESEVFDYDIMPQMPIVLGAGGVVTDWNGRPLGDTRGFETVLMAANGELHRAALELLGG
ncbi:inositol monophosphatase family protein [Mesorhizobium sp. SP-1A]|uniref:inositol monophosphatase family protein n=1 Tax=Mesorhizobium sp. SP-1A TaxID=3077840 RepID=UPI0028F6C4DC|nr:inositol monophosphatase family protein [Mesorhizobium sp. SP-1A]